MNKDALDRILHLVCQEMGCENARLEIGGTPPDAAEVLCATVPGGFRLVAIFQEAPLDRASANLRLRQLTTSFFSNGLQPPSVRPDAELHLNQRRLDDELYALSGRTAATGAVIFDLQSPIIWGCSDGRTPGEDLDTWNVAAELDEIANKRGIDLGIISGLVEEDRSSALEGFPEETRHRLERLLSRLHGRTLRARRNYLLRARAVREVRDGWPEGDQGTTGLRRLIHTEQLGYFARSIAGIYVLLLHFPGPFSELHVEGLALHASPVLERLIVNLPVIDPPPGGNGKVVQLPLRNDNR